MGDPEEVAALCRALAHQSRVSILSFLSQPRYLEEVASHLGTARQTADRHMQELVEAGLVRRQEGSRESTRVVEYVLVPQALYSLAETLAQLGAPVPRYDEAQAPMMRTVATDHVPPALVDGPARLVLVHGRGVGRVFPLPVGAPAAVIGRDPAAHVCLDYDARVSFRHAEIGRAGRGLELIDGLSTNGTFLNGRRLDRGTRAALRHGDVIGVGHSMLLFRADA